MDEKTKNLIVAFGYIGIGALSIILSFMAYGCTNGTDLEKYGGDAYTGIQNAAAATASAVSMGFGSLLLVIGLALIVKGIGALRLENVTAKKAQNPEPGTKKDAGESVAAKPYANDKGPEASNDNRPASELPEKPLL